jgi:hypothetical protein
VEQFPVVDVTDWQVASHEPQGLEPKEWLAEPSAATDPPTWLFKARTVQPWGAQGEDWAEKISTELGGLLGVPCAVVELARRGTELGTISKNLAPRYYEMSTGNVLLSGIVENYRSGRSKVPGRPGHSLANIQTALSQYRAPLDCTAPRVFNAFDVFAGYLVLDALVGNQDRHDENWAVVRTPPPDDQLRLCGSYDHGSSLAFGLSEERRAQFVTEGNIEKWARKGRANRLEHLLPGKPPTLVAAASSALSLASQDAREYWLNRLTSINDRSLVEIVTKVPNLSDPTRTFILEVLRINRRRLLDEC